MTDKANQSNDTRIIEHLARTRQAMQAEVRKVIVGQDDVLELLMQALLSRGHCLLVGVPGLAKTLMISTLAKVLNQPGGLTERDLQHLQDVYNRRLEETDRVIGLTVGADDYVSKPFGAKELVARVKAVLRRQRGTTPAGLHTGRTELSGLTVDVERHEVLKDGEPVTLTALEFELLATMAASPGRVFTRHQLLERVWGWDHVGGDRVVDVHIRKLRKALDDDASDPRFVATVRGVGYKVIDPR